MLLKNEKQLLNFIRYSPIVIILIVAILINILIYFQNEQNFKKDIEVFKENYIHTNKTLTKYQVEKIYKDILQERVHLEEKLENSLKDRVNEAMSIVENLHKKFAHLKEDELLKLIKESLRPIKFNEGRGYFYLVNTDGKMLLHPIDKNYENKNIFKIKNTQNKQVYKDLKNHFKVNDEFLGYINAIKPNNKGKDHKKLSYIKMYKPLNILIGTGEYKDDFIKEVQNHIITKHIENVRYGKNGYIFIFDYDGYQITHAKKSYIGKQRIDLKDANGFMITQEIIKQAKKGSGFISYIGSIMPETGKPAQKTTYIKGVDDWGWAIGSGFYNYDLQKYLKMKKEELKQSNNDALRNSLVITLFLTIVLIALAFYISDILKNSFINYQKKIQNQLNESRKKDIVLFQQSKMASMGEMLNNIAHQWRQPLSTVSTLASGAKIKKELNMLEDKEFENSMDMIVSTTKHLSQTIDDFREFFNPNKMKNSIDTISLHNKATQLISSRLSTKEIELKSDIDSTSFKTFENELLQCLINILNNSIDAFISTKVENRLIEFNIKHKKSCDNKECTVKECTHNEDGYIVISILDNAGGISDDAIDKVFDAYFTTKHKSQGTGIGLYMTYEIITKHLNGFICVDNKKVRYKDQDYIGASFDICLPIEKDE